MLDEHAEELQALAARLRQYEQDGERVAHERKSEFGHGLELGMSAGFGLTATWLEQILHEAIKTDPVALLPAVAVVAAVRDLAEYGQVILNSSEHAEQVQSACPVPTTSAVRAGSGTVVVRELRRRELEAEEGAGKP